MRTQSKLGTVLGYNSPLIDHMKLKISGKVTGLQSSRLVCLIFTYTVSFLSYAYGRRNKKKKEKEGERKKMKKIKILLFGFSTLFKVRGTFRVDLALE